MAGIHHLTLEADDVEPAQSFVKALGVGDRVRVEHGEEATSGFRGFTVSLVVPQPSTVDHLAAAALAAEGVELKPVRKSFWGYGGVVQAPDGTIWKFASPAKKDVGAPVEQIDDVVLLLGVADVKATKQFYVEHGLAVAKSFGSKYVEFEASDGTVKLALYGRKAAAKDAGADPTGDGSHRLVVGGDETFTDPDGFAWRADGE